MTASPPSARPLYLEVDGHAVFATFHRTPRGAASGTAVLLCPTWGWDEVTTYRSRREWAERLARDGHPTLRIDLPGSGDSAGTPTDPDQVEAWRRAISGAAAWLADSPGVARVAAIGLGLGGLVAGAAVAAGAPIDDLVLWAAPVRGRAFLREQRAFAALQSSRLGFSDEHAPGLLPSDWLEIGGFVLTSETMAAIDRLDISEIVPGRLQRALLLGRDRLPVEDVLGKHLRASGVEVITAPGDGWEAMCFHPERYEPPLGVFDQVTAWLAAAAPASDARAAAAAPASPDSRAADHAELVVGPAAIRETPMGHDGAIGGSFGILAEPAEASGTELCAIFLNAGAIRRIGPNRMWVEAARRWAARGVPTFRADVEGIGDAEGDAAIYANVERFYTPDRERQVQAIMDVLEARGLGPRFVLIGLCAGAYSAVHTAAVDDRVIAAIALNPRVLVWDPDLMTRRDARLVKRLLEPGSWRRILSGETEPSRILEIGRIAAAQASRTVLASPARVRYRGKAEPWKQHLEDMLDRSRDKGSRVVLAFSGDEPVHDELEADGILARLDRWPNVVVSDLPERDHTLRPIQAQLAGHELLDRELHRLLAASEGVRPASRGT
jgi:dienelactone hydrolase